MSNDITTTNLLSSSAFKKMQQAETSKQQPAVTAPIVQQPAAQQPSPQLQPQPSADTFNQTAANNMPKASFGKFAEKYSGIAALAISVIGLPVVYTQAKKSSSKTVKAMQEALDDIKNINIKKEIEEAISKLNLPKADASGEAKGSTNAFPASTFLTSMFIGIGSALGINEFVKNNKETLKQNGFKEEDINTASKTASDILNKSENALNTANGISSAASEAKAIAYEAKNAAYGAQNTVNSFDSRINEANQRATDAVKATELGLDPLMQQYTVRHFDLNLLQVLNYAKKIDNRKTGETLNSIHNAAISRLDRTAEQTVRDIKAYKKKFPELTSTWSLTAEYAPIKTGGLGVVPVDIQDNFVKLGIDTPTFIPMYLQKNKSEFMELPNNEYRYTYNGKTFNLRKAAETTTHVFRNGQTKPEKIEYYVTEESIPDSDKKKTLVFVKSRDYFNDNIYDSTTNAEETERFALFTKSVYKLAKLKVNMALTDPNEKNPKTGISNLKICDKEAFDKIKAPNSMILNDWHAGSMASLLRYRAPMEYNYSEISKKTFEALKDMPLLMIGHNLNCQGKSNDGSGSLLSKNRVTENIINTLFDSYAIAITEHAHSGISGENDDMCNTVLMKRRTGDKHFNHLFNGVALSDWFVPVSKNYTTEVINDPMKSGILYPLLQRRQDSGTISGTINGLDKNKVDMHAIAHKNFVKGLDLAEYDQNTGIDKVMELRTENKGRFYNAFIKPIMDGTLDKPEVVGSNVNISEQDFVDAPVISFAHRLTDQKGLSIMKGAIFRLFDNWDEVFPGKKMPFFIVGGPPEAAEELQHLYDLKNGDYGKNKERLNHVLALKGNMPNPAIMAASTFFCAPSTYEPCGLTQGECFAKGTPVITTDVGGFHDTIVDGKTGFLAPYVSEESFYNKLVEALKMYFERPEDYKKMVQNDLEIDFSWVQKDKNGPIFEYTDKLGFDKKDLPDLAAAA